MLAGRDGQSFTIGVFEEFSTPKKYFLISTTLESCGCSNGLKQLPCKNKMDDYVQRIGFTARAVLCSARSFS